MKKVRFSRAFWLCLAVLLSALELPSCTQTGGGLMLEVWQEGLDIDQLEVIVKTEAGTVLVHQDYQVEKSSFPATVGILNDVDHTNLWVQVAGYDDRVVQDARLFLVRYVPAFETRLLTVVLSARCSQYVRADGPHGFELLCPEGETCSEKTGQCESAKIDAGDLPLWDPGQQGVGGRADDSDGSGGSAGEIQVGSGGAATGGTATSGGGGGGQCVPEDKHCSEDGRSVLGCVEGLPGIVASCSADETCSPLSMTCEHLEPACVGQSEGFEFCGADAKRYACGQQGLTSETVEEPCPEGVPCVSEQGVAVCKSGCDVDRGGCDPLVSCTETLDGPVCGACPPDEFSLDGGKNCLERTTCDPGQEVESYGSPTEDRTCNDCPAGHYSTEENAESCDAFGCGSGLVAFGPGSPTSNQLCLPPGLGQWGTSGNDAITGMARDADGNILLTGYTYGDLLAKSQGGADIFVIKLSSSLAFVWGVQLGTSADDLANAVTVNAVAVNPTGDVFVAGVTEGALGGTPAQGKDAFLLKLKSDGTQDWVRIVATAADDRGVAAAVSAEGRVFVAGGTRGGLSGSNAGGEDAFARAFDASGTVVFTDQFGTSGDDSIVGIVAGGPGDVFAAATVAGNLSGNTGFAGSISVAVRGYEQNNGQFGVDWTEQFGEGSATEAFALAYHPSTDRVHVVGSTNGVLRDPITNTLLSNAGGKDVFMRGYRADGADAFAREYGTPADDVGRAITVADNGRIWMCGNTPGTLGTQAVGGLDLFVKDYSQTGQVGDPVQFGTTLDDSCGAIVTIGTRVLVAGTTSGTFSGSASLGATDVFLVEAPSPPP
jgi:hypothetical protein